MIKLQKKTNNENKKFMKKKETNNHNKKVIKVKNIYNKYNKKT